MKTKLKTCVRAGYAGLFVVTAEEARAEAEIRTVADDLGYGLSAWSVTEGLVDTSTGNIRDVFDPMEALEAIDGLEEKRIVVLRDFGMFFDDADPMLVRRLRDVLRRAKADGRCLVLLGCRHDLPEELRHEITLIEFALPEAEQLGTVLDGILESAGIGTPPPEIRELSIRAARGLTTVEAENAFALSVVEFGNIDPAIVAREKANALREGGLLEVIETVETLDRIGGLDVLKEWLVRRSDAFGQRARDYGLPAPKGLLIIGIPGTGKSLTAKATASVFGLPLLRLDMGRVFGGLVGQSESNLRAVIQTAEAIAPCVLWIDEIEKGFAGSRSSGSTDGGTSSRVFGSFLSWMQDKTAPVFVVATANDISQLPPEFLRKGRFDEIFFVDVPNQQERSAIWDIVIAKHSRDKRDFDTAHLARACETYTGAEIEQTFIDALYAAFEDQGREPTELDIATVLTETVPLFSTMAEHIERLRQWAKGRARHATHADRSGNGRRKLDLS